jgi:hypothetical protein
VTILSERELTEAERAAIADEARPGVWVQMPPSDVLINIDHFKPNGDGRALTQDETDLLIARELFREHSDDATRIIVSTWLKHGLYFQLAEPIQQRGGIHSDPLVRLLAIRAWGDRDRAWRKRDTARALLGVRRDEAVDDLRLIYGFEGVSQLGLQFTANRDGFQVTGALSFADVADNRRPLLDLMLDLFDELDAKLAAGGEPVPSGPLTFDLSSSPT